MAELKEQTRPLLFVEGTGQCTKNNRTMSLCHNVQ